MQYIYGFENFHSSKPSAITFGKFDGLHRGHQILVGYVKAYGQGDDMNSIVCSIDKNPDVVLMTKDEQKAKLKPQVDYLVTCPFTEEFKKMPAETFIRDVIKGVFHAEYVVVGFNFLFGHNAEGSVWLLQQLAEKYNYKVVVVGEKTFRGQSISSTYIRSSLKRGEIELANSMLGYNYGITGRISHGQKLGTTLGVPTLNIVWPDKKLIPPRGVYLAKVFVDGHWYNGVANIGTRPTVTNDKTVVFECFLLRFNGNIYGRKAKAELIDFLRPEEKFNSIDELKAQLKEDIIAAKTYFECSKR